MSCARTLPRIPSRWRCEAFPKRVATSSSSLSDRLAALTELLGGSARAHAALLRAPAPTLAAVAALPDAVLVQRLVRLRGALPSVLHAGLLVAAAPRLLLDAEYLLGSDFTRDWQRLKICLSPCSEADLAAACHERPDVLLRVTAIEDIVAELQRLGWTQPQAAIMVLGDPGLLQTAARPDHKARDSVDDEYYV